MSVEHTMYYLLPLINKEEVKNNKRNTINSEIIYCIDIHSIEI